MSTAASKPNERMADAVLLFRFSVPLKWRVTLWTAKGADLPEECAIPCFAQLDQKKLFAELRGGWNDSGLAFALRVTGKKEAIWRNEKTPTAGDGLQLFIDTRDTHNIHRASRYCHRFAFMPLASGAGGTKQLQDSLAAQLAINRARESPKPVERGVLQVISKRIETGYQLDTFLPAAALTGFDPAEHPKLGFHYLVSDRELGEQTFAVSTAFPSDDDPSLWGTLELVK
jgi:hypothetical protein